MDLLNQQKLIHLLLITLLCYNLVQSAPTSNGNAQPMRNEDTIKEELEENELESSYVQVTDSNGERETLLPSRTTVPLTTPLTADGNGERGTPPTTITNPSPSRVTIPPSTPLSSDDNGERATALPTITTPPPSRSTLPPSTPLSSDSNGERATPPPTRITPTPSRATLPQTTPLSHKTLQLLGFTDPEASILDWV